MSRNWRWETTSERVVKLMVSFAVGWLMGMGVSSCAHAAPQPLTIVVCAQQAASFRYEGGVMYVTCPPDNKPVLTVYGCVGPSLDRNKTPGPRGYEYTFKCQSWTTYVQTPKT